MEGKREILENLEKAIYDYDKILAEESAKKAIELKIDPIEAIDVMTKAIKKIGDAFGRGELWLPDLVGASDAMQSAVSIFEEEIKKEGKHRETLGTVVIGTVFGDIHSIGKTMVATLLTASGFEVHDIGVNVPADKFVEAIKQSNANILAISALMTTTCLEQEKVINTLKEYGIRDKVRVMVGGAATTKEFAETIGADDYAPTAPGAVELARSLIKV